MNICCCNCSVCNMFDQGVLHLHLLMCTKREVGSSKTMLIYTVEAHCYCTWLITEMGNL